MAVDVNVLLEQLEATHSHAGELMVRARQASDESRLFRKLSREGRIKRRPSLRTVVRAQPRVVALPPPECAPAQHGATALTGTALTGAEPHTPEVEGLRREVAQLREALAARPVVDQARGVLMAVGSCGAEPAWDVLVETSQRTNTKLRRVAEMVVASAEGQKIPEPVRTQLRRSMARRSAAQ
ncbi:ANTAR domain-containing protein [Streptomyces sp. NPDC046853]|uniref:ANTAR domain-containing protein n=1 Tax=Streptomyces sp. NPDC046853 TaxID=3154920 RepID=UPI0033D32982